MTDTGADVLDETGLSWGERRRRGIGASEVAGVVGRHPWSSPWSIWARKVGLIPVADEPKQDTDSDAARFGRDLEPITARWFHERTGLHVGGEQMMLRHPERPWARATIDGLVFDRATDLDDPVDALGVLELKYTGQSPWALLPEYHALQVQWQLYVSGLCHGWLAAFHTGFGRLAFRVYEVERDDVLIDDLVAEVERFWTVHVIGGQPPPVDGSEATTEALKAVYGADVATEQSTELTAGAAHAVELLRDAKANRRDLDDVIAELENELRAALGDRTEGRVGGFRVVSWRPQSRTVVDLERLRAEHGDRYDRTSSTRVLRLHKGRS
jgi:putative phage-type endonuclease